jgi:hypothetical protein
LRGFHAHRLERFANMSTGSVNAGSYKSPALNGKAGLAQR